MKRSAPGHNTRSTSTPRLGRAEREQELVISSSLETGRARWRDGSACPGGEGTIVDQAEPQAGGVGQYREHAGMRLLRNGIDKNPIGQRKRVEQNIMAGNFIALVAEMGVIA